MTHQQTCCTNRQQAGAAKRAGPSSIELIIVEMGILVIFVIKAVLYHILGLSFQLRTRRIFLDFGLISW
jgi:hypothetical protein